MGKDSVFYKGKQRSQKLTYRELLTKLPHCAVAYLHSKEGTTQSSTRIAYCYDLINFFEFLQQENPVCRNIAIKDFPLDILGQLTSEDILEFQRYLELNVVGKSHENDKKAIARKMAPLRGMYQYHFLHGNIKENPMLLVPLPKVKKDKNIIRMNNAEVRDILQAIENGYAAMTPHQRSYCEKTRIRDLAILTLFLNTGIRVSECNGLDLTDVDLRANTIVIVRKGGGQDVLYFGDIVKNALSDYIETERKTTKPAEGHENALFLSLQGKRMSVDALENLVKKYALAAVPHKKITPHKLRSTYGTALYRETGDIRLVADVLGHENINTTIEHYAAIEDEHRREAAGAVDYRRKQ